MSIEQKAHYGGILFDSMKIGDFDIPFLILQKAPLKYYEELPEDDKTKADVVLAFVIGEWKLVGHFRVEQYEDKAKEIYDAMERLICKRF